MRCTGGRWGHVEDGGRKAARGQVTEAASVEEAEAWCVAAGDDVGRASTFVTLPTAIAQATFTDDGSD